MRKSLTDAISFWNKFIVLHIEFGFDRLGLGVNVLMIVYSPINEIIN